MTAPVAPSVEAPTLADSATFDRRNFATLLAVARASRGVTDPNVVLMAIYEELAKLLPIDAFSVVVCTDDNVDAYRYMLMIDEGVYYTVDDDRSGGLTGYILQHQEPLFFSDLHAERPPDLPPTLAFGNATRRSRAWMGVPLLAGRAVLGAMTVQSYQRGVYTRADYELLLALADLAAVAIENAVLYEQQRELTHSLAERVTARQEELAVLSTLAASLGRGQSSPELLNEALERVLWLFGLDAGVVWLLDRRHKLRRIAWRATGEPPVADEQLLITGTSPEARALHEHHLLQQAERGERWRCAVPLQAHGHNVGVITLWGGRRLGEHETALLEAAADQMALGIENSRLLRERDRQIRQLEALSTIAEMSAATRDLNAMFRAVRSTLRDLLGIDGLLAALYDPATQRLHAGLAWHVGDGERVIAAPEVPSPHVQHLLQGGAPLLLHLHGATTRGADWERGAAAWLGVPMLDQSAAPIGVLAIQNADPDAFDQRDLQFMSNVAHQLTLNVLNAQLYADARASAAVAERRANNLALVHNISRLVGASLDPTEVLRIAAEQLTRLFGVDHAAVMLWNDDGTQGQIVTEYPALGTTGLRFALNANDFIEDVPGSGQPVFVTDIVNDSHVRPVRFVALQRGIRAMLLIPLLGRGQSFGTISLHMIEAERVFTDEDFELCRTIAAQVTTALDNARLHQVAVTRVEQELEIARGIQANLFPRTLPDVPGVAVAARCVPARETGGDFYDVLPLGDGRYSFSVGDVSGKSLPAAMLMAVARSVVRSEALDHAAPEMVMAETNRLIAQDVPPNAFVALCYAVYNTHRRELVLASAGQMTPLVRHADGSVDWLPVEPNLPLGIVPDLEYTATTVLLHPGDTVLFFTDGLVEAFNPQGEMWGFARLETLFAICGDAPPTDVVATLLDKVCAWQGNENRHDDMTAIVAHIE